MSIKMITYSFKIPAHWIKLSPHGFMMFTQ